jgi:hypothetical protein
VLDVIDECKQRQQRWYSLKLVLARVEKLSVEIELVCAEVFQITATGIRLFSNE